MMLFIIFCLAVSSSIFQVSEANCGCRFEYKRVGCFKDRYHNRSLPEQIMNERDTHSAVYNGNMINWFNWDIYMPAMVCRCAEIALKKGYKYFGMQFWGECWSGNTLSENAYEKHGPGQNCFGKGYRLCSPMEDSCVGGESYNFVYEVATYKCPLKFEKIGCYKDFSRRNMLALTARDDRSAHYMGSNIDWINYNTFLPEFACKCAQAIVKKGYNTFGLQYYGECWTGLHIQNGYQRAGKSHNCINKCFKQCERFDKFCIGKGYANTIYRITHMNCSQKYEPVACYASGDKGNLALPELLITDMAPQSPMFQGHMMTFHENWGKNLKDLVCRCAKKAASKGYKTIGIGNHGECWSGVWAHKTYNKHGASGACRQKKKEPCTDNRMCAGDKSSVYVFNVLNEIERTG